jgi:hypothetical protein
MPEYPIAKPAGQSLHRSHGKDFHFQTLWTPLKLQIILFRNALSETFSVWSVHLPVYRTRPLCRKDVM